MLDSRNSCRLFILYYSGVSISLSFPAFFLDKVEPHFHLQRNGNTLVFSDKKERGVGENSF